MKALLVMLVAACATESRATPDGGVDAMPTVKVACDGALCDTTTSSTCSTGAPSELAWIAVPLAVLVIRRRRR